MAVQQAEHSANQAGIWSPGIVMVGSVVAPLDSGGVGGGDSWGRGVGGLLKSLVAAANCESGSDSLAAPPPVLLHLSRTADGEIKWRRCRWRWRRRWWWGRWRRCS